jgi:predicted CopG family antitoxin
MNTMRVKLVKNIRIHDHAYEHLAKHVEYPESMADTLDRLLGLKAKDKDSRK